MVILVTGATHTGKTNFAQRLLNSLRYPYVSQDHIKMGLIRSGNTELTPNDDDRMTEYLWPITKEMIKTAIENQQNLIVEGCYIPFDWKKDFNEDYLKDIQYICLCLSDEYIDKHFDLIKAKESCIEKRMYDDCDEEVIRRDNRIFLEGCQKNGLQYILIREDYRQEIADGLRLFADEPGDCCFANGNNWFRYRTGGLIVEDDSVLFITSKNTEYYYTVGGGVHLGETAESCIKREVFEETGVEYDIDHLAVIVENFFTGKGGAFDGMDCQCLEFYYLMKPRGSKELNSNSVNADNEREIMEWIPLSKIRDYDIKPSFLKERMDEIVHGSGVIHVVSELDRAPKK